MKMSNTILDYKIIVVFWRIIMCLFEANEYKPDWLDIQCDKISAALGDLSLEQRLMVIEQFMEYLRFEESDTENHN